MSTFQATEIHPILPLCPPQHDTARPVPSPSIHGPQRISGLVTSGHQPHVCTYVRQTIIEDIIIDALLSIRIVFNPHNLKIH